MENLGWPLMAEHIIHELNKEEMVGIPILMCEKKKLNTLLKRIF